MWIFVAWFNVVLVASLDGVPTVLVLFTVLNNGLLIVMNINNGKIIYSHDINQKIASFLKTKKKSINIKNILIVNDKIMLFLENSYVVYFNINGSVNDIFKLPSKLNTIRFLLPNLFILEASSFSVSKLKSILEVISSKLIIMYMIINLKINLLALYFSKK